MNFYSAECEPKLQGGLVRYTGMQLLVPAPDFPKRHWMEGDVLVPEIKWTCFEGKRPPKGSSTSGQEELKWDQGYLDSLGDVGK